jgi:hypothetical protein
VRRTALAFLVPLLAACTAGAPRAQHAVSQAAVTRVAAPRPAATASSRPSATASPRARVTRTPVRRSPAPAPRARRSPYAVTGDLRTVPGTGPVLGRGPLRRFRVQVERGVLATPAQELAFADAVARTLGDDRSWGHGGRMSFQRVSGGSYAFTVVLAGPRTTDRLCLPLDTGGIFSCYQRGRSVINAHRWFDGARSYAGHLAEYRQYVVNHEVGHALGHDHARACRGDGLAPTMMQQTKSLYGCRRNAWPFP